MAVPSGACALIVKPWATAQHGSTNILFALVACVLRLQSSVVHGGPSRSLHSARTANLLWCCARSRGELWRAAGGVGSSGTCFLHLCIDL